ncbi:hypothetical protein GGE65_001461 [Skermanella aerolata]|jgi:hypothetical protein|uniref:Uncharacterized protein n=1 Tax=Skermanella aerolata TaxID=393310 RepID=A0A512DJS6_9PROT|nr:hypothetical protein [Skermanella aerolata]KJB97210.1 hypothetical protein N826_29480 [Skermanella aerolata KACC 11604]GEO36722.1 hypothetical protein SAE02_08700 [Skermanella aerolata]
MDETTSLNISPYLLRPIRKLEDVLAKREEDQLRKIRPPMTANNRFVLILGGKR